MRLRKRDAEALLAGYDADPRGALETALRIARDRPAAPYAELVADLDDGPALLAGDPEACDALARRLNEDRGL